MSNSPLLFISAGDPSGDNAVSRVITHLKGSHPDLKMFGLGGDKLASLGQEQLCESSSLAVLGFWEVAKKYFFFRKLFYSCLNEIKKRKPDVVLLVDYPGFNIRLAKKVKTLGIPVIYYISPQVWAWGKGRLKNIKENVDRMLPILPFEESFYQKNGVECTFVGNYLLEDIPPEMITSDIPENKQVALLPGSRLQEVQRMFPVMLKAASILEKSHNCKFVVAAVKDLYDYESAIKNSSIKNIEIVYNKSREVINSSETVITASGTATLEVGIIGRPMVIIYKTGFITYHIARTLVSLSNIGLVNLVLGENVVPELIQNEVSPDKIASAMIRYFDDHEYREKVVPKLRTVPELLGGTGASKRTAEIIGEYLC